MTHHAKTLCISQFLFCQPIFLGIDRGIRAFLGSISLLTYLLLGGLRKGGLGDRKHSAQGGFELLKWSFEGRHGEDNTTSLPGGLQ